jgi:23S rRNA (adenine2503-C2)-methyltransferase
MCSMSIEFAAKPPVRALSSLDRAEAEHWAESRRLPRYRGRQLWLALNSRAAQHVDELTDLPAAVRAHIAADETLRSVEPIIHLRSERDDAEKVLFRLSGGGTVEAVLIRGRNANGGSRLTVCVSSQVGCPAGCTFCATGLSGFSRNLRSAEIVDQVMYFAHSLRSSGERVNNVVYMGMGEPLLNVPAVRDSIKRLSDPAGLGLGERHMTVSTVGIVPQIRRLASWAGQVNLAVSLHAPGDELRTRLVPYNRHFPIAQLMAAVKSYAEHTNRRVSFEYVLLRGVNDDVGLAADLAALVLPFGPLAHVNLIPWNPFREGHFVRSEGPDAEAFAAALRARGTRVTVRYSKGLDISAACGQLRDQAADALVC